MNENCTLAQIIMYIFGKHYSLCMMYALVVKFLAYES